MVGQLSRRLLLVDDDVLFRKLLARHLVAAGNVVRTAENGLDAIAKLRAGLPDLIITDLNMPGMSGRELLGVVRTRFPQIPVIAISSATTDEVLEALAADSYWHKSGLGFQQLLEAVSDLVGKRPLRPAPPPIDNEPVQARWDRDGRYFIHCDDCLREFSDPRVFPMGRDKKWATCMHCGKSLPFFIAERSEEG